MKRVGLSLLCCFCVSAAELPWYMKETAMTDDGRLTFLSKSWWPRAKALAEGGSFTLDLNRDGRPDTLIQKTDGNVVEIIDDSGKAQDLASNQSSAAYVVSFNATGLVDRMVVYIDNDGDGKADETDFRHYRDGYLRYSWFSESHDGKGGQVFMLKNWSYVGGNDFRNKFRGDSEIYLNKYDPVSRSWLPLSECPFTFWDSDKDGHSDLVLRVSAAPLSSNSGSDTDYANRYDYMWAPNATPLSEMGAMNVRFSYNLDPDPRKEPVEKPHFTFGFTLVGEQPYDFPGMRYTNPRRRPPQTVVRLPRTSGVDMGMRYPAQSTGFTWDEARSVFRWEGQFWIYEREYMPNTGGPVMRWNMRREYSPLPSKERSLYYSDVDKRYHLLGAREGWMEVGHLVNDTKDLEFRYFDSDGDGYLDTTQVLLGSNPVPVRVSRVLDVRSRAVTLTRDAMREDYNNRILPEAIRGSEKLIAVLKTVVQSPLAVAYEAEAQKADNAERRRFCLDIARELYFLAARLLFYERNAANPYASLPAAKNSSRTFSPGPVDGGYTLGDTLRFWKTAKLIEAFIASYESGEMESAASKALEIVETK
jgi:hypothetical protein